MTVRRILTHHVEILAAGLEASVRFYQAALAPTGASKISPALHPEYHATYYGAFVWDLHHNYIEAVFHGRD